MRTRRRGRRFRNLATARPGRVRKAGLLHIAALVEHVFRYQLNCYSFILDAIFFLFEPENRDPGKI